MIEDLNGSKPDDDSVKLLRMLAHPTRLAVLQILRAGEECVCHMEAVLGLRQAYLSQQLALLREAGLVADRRDGWNNFYRLADPRLIPLLDALSGVTGADSPQGHTRRTEENCPCPKCSALVDKAAETPETQSTTVSIHQNGGENA